MDDRPLANPRESRLRSSGIRASRPFLALGLAVMVSALGGCSLFVMAGKMVFGDPLQECGFKRVTRVDLTDGEHQVLIVAKTPASVKQEMPSADLVITEQVSRVLENEGVAIYPSKKVLSWVDDRGGRWGSPQEIAEAFPKVDYIIRIDIDHLTHHEENSPTLLRGHASGNVSAYEVVTIGEDRSASPVFSQTFKSTYPRLYPKQAHQISERTFQKEFLDRVCRQIAQAFYDYHARDAVL